MFRNVSGEGHLSGRHSPASSPGHGVSSPGLVSQESSWIGLLSRPALALLQRILPGPRVQNPALAEKGPGWLPADLNSSFVHEENEFLRQLDDMMPLPQHPPPHLSYLRCDHSGPLEPRTGASAWMTADSLRELGLQSPADLDLNLCQQTQLGYFSSVRTFLNQVLLSSQDLRSPSDWMLEAGGPPANGSAGRGRWGSFWGAEEGSQRGLLSDLSWGDDQTAPGLLCPPAGTKAAPVFVQSREWMLGEPSGPGLHKEQLANKEGPHTVQNVEGSGTDLRLSIQTHQSSEVAVLTREQDHGYCSLEEEQLKARTPEEEPPAAQQGGSGGPVDFSAPQCQNKAIAFIMGCPCSDDDSSQSDGDDGFDSEDSSDLSESEDTGEDDSDPDSEVDSESERLWSSLCQNHDPYNPQNFTARLQSSTELRPIPGSTPASSPRSSSPRSSSPRSSSPRSSSPRSSPPRSSSPASSISSSSPPSGLDVWEDSASASEADEAESLRLWSSFSSSDPYSPFNFQAPLRTQGPAEAPSGAQTRGRKASPTPRPAPAPEYRRGEAEERLDSGFSEPSRTQSCSINKKVRFSDVIEEFFLGSEDRRGPWEEFARDRCRFLRRCQEVEQNISYVLQPQHRRRMQHRMEASTLQQNMETSTLQHRMEASTLQQNMEASTLQQNMEASTLQHRMEASTLQHRMEASTLQQNMETSTLQQNMEASTLQHRMEASTLQQNMETSTLQQNMETSTLQQNMETSTLQHRMEASTLQHRMEASTLQHRMEASTLQQKTETSTLQHRMEASTLQQKTETSTLQQNMETSTLQHRMETSTLQQNMEASTLQQKTETSTLQQNMETSTLQHRMEASTLQQNMETSTLQDT